MAQRVTGASMLREAAKQRFVQQSHYLTLTSSLSRIYGRHKARLKIGYPCFKTSSLAKSIPMGKNVIVLGKNIETFGQEHSHVCLLWPEILSHSHIMCIPGGDCA